MMAQDGDGVHLYGTPDAKDQAPPPENGLHGEAKARGSHPEFRHNETLSDGSTVVVEEQSGVAFVEAIGTAGLTERAVEKSATAAPAPFMGRNPAPARSTPAQGSGVLPYVVGLASAVVVAALAKRRQDAGQDRA